MKKYLSLNILLIAIRRVLVRCKLLSRKLNKHCHASQKYCSAPDALLVHIELLGQILDEPFPDALSSHIMLLRTIGYPVRVTRLQEQTTDGVIGYLSCYHARILQYQEELRTQSVMIEKKTIASRRIFQLNQPIQKAVFCNK